jgi:hypothetical protein
MALKNSFPTHGGSVMGAGAQLASRPVGPGGAGGAAAMLRVRKCPVPAPGAAAVHVRLRFPGPGGYWGGSSHPALSSTMLRVRKCPVPVPGGRGCHVRLRFPGPGGARLVGQAVQAAEGGQLDQVPSERDRRTVEPMAAATTSAASTWAGAGAAPWASGASTGCLRAGCLPKGGMWPCGCAGCMCRRRPRPHPGHWRSVAAHRCAPQGAAPPCSPVAAGCAGRLAPRRQRRLALHASPPCTPRHPIRPSPPYTPCHSIRFATLSRIMSLTHRVARYAIRDQYVGPANTHIIRVCVGVGTRH